MLALIPNRNYCQLYKKVAALQIQYKKILSEIQSTGAGTVGGPPLGETLINWNVTFADCFYPFR